MKDIINIDIQDWERLKDEQHEAVINYGLFSPEAEELRRRIKSPLLGRKVPREKRKMWYEK